MVQNLCDVLMCTVQSVHRNIFLNNIIGVLQKLTDLIIQFKYLLFNKYSIYNLFYSEIMMQARCSCQVSWLLLRHTTSQSRCFSTTPVVCDIKFRFRYVD